MQEENNRNISEGLNDLGSKITSSSAQALMGKYANAAVASVAGTAVAPGVGTIAGIAISNGDKIATFCAGIFLFLGIIVSSIGIGRAMELNDTEYVSNTYALSNEVMQLKDEVEAAAEIYESSEYVNLYLAVMMQESAGKAIDVFQCAESLGYEPQGMTGNAITTEESIEQGVYLLSQRLKSAAVESPYDLAHIKLALQSYNMGYGFLLFANENYDGYTLEAALEFQKIQSEGVERTTNVEELGPYSYGDAYYVQHVLRYYSYGTNQNSNTEIPSFYQDDYPNVAFGSSTIAVSGCGITSMAMVASYLSGNIITPEDAVLWCGDRYYTDAGVSWAYFGAATSYFNLGVSVTATTDVEAVKEALKDNKPVICSQSQGLFTMSGHIIVLSGIDEEDKVYVNDPYKYNAIDRDYNNRTFDLETEIDVTAKQYWIFG